VERFLDRRLFGVVDLQTDLSRVTETRKRRILRISLG
jgi:hypothetical protein